MNRTRLLLADDHKLVLEGLQKVLEPEFEVVGQVEDGRALLEAARQLRPDVILVDISMPLLNGIDALRQLCKRRPESKSIVVSMHSDRHYIVEAFRAGASGFVLKRSKPSELRAAIRAVMRGEQYLAGDLGIAAAEVSRLVKRASSTTRPRLTPRQREVLQLVAEGRSNKEVAAMLDISVKGVEFHKAALARKLGSKKTSELTRYAVNAGLVAGGIRR